MCVGGLAKASLQQLLRPWEEKALETYFGPLLVLSVCVLLLQQHVWSF